MELKRIQAIIEAMLFASGDPVQQETLIEILEIDKKTLGLVVSQMMNEFMEQNRGIMIREINGGYQLCSNPDYFEYVKKLFEPKQKHGLSQAALETLAIVAYNQPVTKAGVERIRGVNSDSAINSLVERNLVAEAGRMDAPGKPILYETTEEFLRCFGYKSLADLPLAEEFFKVEEEFEEGEPSLLPEE